MSVPRTVAEVIDQHVTPSRLRCSELVGVSVVAVGRKNGFPTARPRTSAK
jgi:hypothetical protein